MPGSQRRALLHHLRRLVGPRADLELPDADLLRRWVAQRDEAAFEVLLWRHGPMVLRVCRRLAGGAQDAEDAFQATFLALVRRAGSIGRGEAVAGWLYKVAYRAALRARGQAARQPAGGARVLDVPAPDRPDELLWRDLRPVLEEEVERLPARLRAAFVLCYLEGKTNEQAARALGCPTGTVVSRLARARQRLRARLSRRGVTLSAGVLAAGLADAAALPPALVELTRRAAVAWASGTAACPGVVSARVAALTEGVYRTMGMTKFKWVTALLLTAVVVTAGIITYRGTAAEPAPRERPARPAARGGEGAGPAAEGQDRGPARFARLQLRQAETELLQVQSELRRKQIELALLLRKEGTVGRGEVPASFVEQRVGGDALVVKLAGRLMNLRDSLHNLENGEAIKKRTLQALKATQDALEQRRAELRQQSREEWREKAREDWRQQVEQLRGKVAFLQELEKELTREVERLGKETASGRGTTEERLRSLEREVRELKAKMAEMRREK